MKIKYILPLLALIFLPTLVAPNNSQAATTCTATVNKSTVNPGENFDLTVNFSDGENHTFVYWYIDNNGNNLSGTVTTNSNPYTVTLKAPATPFAKINIHQPPRTATTFSCDAAAKSTAPALPAASQGTTNTGICELVGTPVSNPNSSDPTDRRILMTLKNNSTDDIKVHVAIQFSANEKLQYGDDVTLAGTNTGLNGGSAFYALPVPVKAPAGSYLVVVSTKQTSYYTAVCTGSGKKITLEEIPNSNRAITSTLRNVDNPTPFTSLGSILTALVPNLFALAGMLAFVFLVYGGIRFALARGDAKATDAARGVITNAITGLLIILSVFVIFEIITNVFKITIFSFIPTVRAQATVDIGCAVKLGSQCIKNAFPTFGSLVTVIIAAAAALMGLIFFVLLIWGGIRYMLSRGDEKATQQARGILTSAIIGLLIVLGAFAIITLIGILTGQSNLLP